MFTWIENFFLHFRTKFEIFQTKRPCNQAFQNKLLSDVSDPTGYSVPSSPWNYICTVLLNRIRRAKRSRRKLKCRKWKRRKLNEQHYSSFQARNIKTSKLLSRSVICKIEHIYVCWIWFVIWSSFNQSIKLDWFKVCTFKRWFSAVGNVTYLAIFSSKPSCQSNNFNDKIVID